MIDPGRPGRDQRLRAAARWMLAAIFFAAGIAHLAMPAPFMTITPAWVPFPAVVIMLTGIAELCGAVGLAQGASFGLRRWAAIGLAVYSLCVWPANAQHMMIDLARPDGGAGLGYHVPRMLFQPVVIWLVLWSGGVIDWPRRKRLST